jgi:hypothetical protein
MKRFTCTSVQFGHPVEVQAEIYVPGIGRTAVLGHQPLLA